MEVCRMCANCKFHKRMKANYNEIRCKLTGEKNDWNYCCEEDWVSEEENDYE